MPGLSAEALSPSTQSCTGSRDSRSAPPPRGPGTDTSGTSPPISRLRNPFNRLKRQLVQRKLVAPDEYSINGTAYAQVQLDRTMYSRLTRITTPEAGFRARAAYKSGGTTRLKFEYRAVNYVGTPTLCSVWNPYRWRLQGQHVPPESYPETLWAGALAIFAYEAPTTVTATRPLGVVIAYNADARHGHCYLGAASFRGRRRLGEFCATGRCRWAHARLRVPGLELSQDLL